jgi:broad specificity phosphatase PhoE
MSAIYLIRHQEPAVLHRFLGRTDPPLSPAGRNASAELSALEVHTVYVSPLRRARETAEAIRREPVVLPELAEIGFGEWEGLTWGEIEQRWPQLAERKADDWLGVTPPGGEPWPQFCARVERALAQILLAPQPVAVVAHLTVNAVLAAHLLGADPQRFQQNYGEVIVCEHAVEHSAL